jgi:3-deoxy-manno-octulosonate cytidylyltransferase (CMP-KDO synthetase)
MELFLCLYIIANIFRELKMSKVVAVIPCRFASIRLPAKPLLRESGMYLVEHVYRAVCRAKCLDTVVVATDDQRIFDAVIEFGGLCEMTSIMHKSGTDRLVEVASRVKGDIYVNVQGDEPEISPDAIEEVVHILKNSNAPVGTLAYKITAEEAMNPNIVKVVCNSKNQALYFSRARIPYNRDNADNIEYLGHVGMYAYTRDFLVQYSNLGRSRLEEIEKLEQLRVLENGFSIVVGITNYRSHGIEN